MGGLTFKLWSKWPLVSQVWLSYLFFGVSRSPFSAKQWPLHRSASLNVIPDHPHINYLSFSVDETLDEVFSEADLKYLTNNQLQELQQISGRRKTRSRDRAVTFSVLQEDRSVLSRKGSVEKEHLCDASSVTAMDYTWNNLSMATKEYLGKYCLVPGKPANSASGTGNQKVATKVTDITSETAASHTSAASQGCSAPPSTPEPSSKNESDSQILDITRLKKLPKLFWQEVSCISKETSDIFGNETERISNTYLLYNLVWSCWSE